MLLTCKLVNLSRCNSGRLAATCITKRNTRNFINKFLQPANRRFTLKTKMNPEEIHAVCVATTSIFGGFPYKPNIENQAE